MLLPRTKRDAQGTAYFPLATAPTGCQHRGGSELHVLQAQ